jgi:hypothetical protein
LPTAPGHLAEGAAGTSTIESQDELPAGLSVARWRGVDVVLESTRDCDGSIHLRQGPPLAERDTPPVPSRRIAAPMRRHVVVTVPPRATATTSSGGLSTTPLRPGVFDSQRRGETT